MAYWSQRFLSLRLELLLCICESADSSKELNPLAWASILGALLPGLSWGRTAPAHCEDTRTAAASCWGLCPASEHPGQSLSTALLPAAHLRPSSGSPRSLHIHSSCSRPLKPNQIRKGDGEVRVFLGLWNWHLESHLKKGAKCFTLWGWIQGSIHYE